MLSNCSAGAFSKPSRLTQQQGHRPCMFDGASREACKHQKQVQRSHRQRCRCMSVLTPPGRQASTSFVTKLPKSGWFTLHSREKGVRIYRAVSRRQFPADALRIRCGGCVADQAALARHAGQATAGVALAASGT